MGKQNGTVICKQALRSLGSMWYGNERGDTYKTVKLMLGA